MDRPEYTIGIVTGAGSENLVRRLFRQAEIKSYKGPTELILGLEQGQVDAIVYNVSFWKTRSGKSLTNSIS